MLAALLRRRFWRIEAYSSRVHFAVNSAGTASITLSETGSLPGITGTSAQLPSCFTKPGFWDFSQSHAGSVALWAGCRGHQPADSFPGKESLHLFLPESQWAKAPGLRRSASSLPDLFAIITWLYLCRIG